MDLQKPKVFGRPEQIKELMAMPKFGANHVRPSGFDVRCLQVGNSTWTGSDGKHIGVWYEEATGNLGQMAAEFVLGKIDDLMDWNDRVFAIRGQGGNVIVASQQTAGGGAYHYGCDFASGGDWYCSLYTDSLAVFGLAQAEITESYMGVQRKGWDCGGSGGEALSRYLAEIVSGGPFGSLTSFASGPSWNDTDWIDRDQGTDQDYPSIGCGVLYLWWMTSLGYTPDQLTQTGEPDGALASNYAKLTNKDQGQAFNDFKAAVGVAGQRSDNPWNTPTPAFPGPSTPPTTDTGTQQQHHHHHHKK